MDIYAALRGRRSISNLRNDAPARAIIQRIIDAAVWAPNHHLTEPWRFHALAGGARERLGEAVATWLRRERDPTDAAVQAEIKSAGSRLMRAPVVVVVAQVVADDALTALEDYAACCSATQNLLLAAHAEGARRQVAHRANGGGAGGQAVSRPAGGRPNRGLRVCGLSGREPTGGFAHPTAGPGRLGRVGRVG